MSPNSPGFDWRGRWGLLRRYMVLYYSTRLRADTTSAGPWAPSDCDWASSLPSPSSGDMGRSRMVSQIAIDSSCQAGVMMRWTDGLCIAGNVEARTLGQVPDQPPLGRDRHAYGHGPFAVLRMPPLPASPGIYVWCSSGDPVYVGQTRGTLRSRLGPNGYSRIST